MAEPNGPLPEAGAKWPIQRSTRPRPAAIWLAAGIAIGVVGGYAIAVGVYSQVTSGTGNGPTPVSSVAVDPSYSLVGAGRQYAALAFCAAATTMPGSDWLCKFAITNSNGSSPNPIYLTKLLVANASEVLLLPNEGTMIDAGATVHFALTIQVGSNSATLNPEVVLDVEFTASR